jgi:hypothetical protein
VVASLPTLATAAMNLLPEPKQKLNAVAPLLAIATPLEGAPSLTIVPVPAVTAAPKVATPTLKVAAAQAVVAAAAVAANNEPLPFATVTLTYDRI